MTPKNLLLFALTATVSFTACNNKPADKPVKSETAPIGSAALLSQPLSAVTGSWTGMFEPDGSDSTAGLANKITVFIAQLADGNISGYSVCAGNERPFSGNYEEQKGIIKATLNEPGNNKYDGVFELEINKENKNLTGKWTPFNKALTGRHYTLERKNFKYDPSEGEQPNASARLLSANDVNNLLKDELRYMRNEIYARHGYSFKLKEVRQMFDSRDWYMPVSTDVRKKLTPIEVRNEKMIKNFEKYAEESYDDYGR
ncbi:hypothetical protein A4D02_30645 [Niastella koreensis]|uniref:YARHG domain-containing protein n=2 Tax=Niastella koreensis TaxID=354356 RepID=G8TIY0_NIAKG|nr:YARHG domain-containing protein [Niastella koreensis]AEV97497.1 hypothetical protein Niako_1122 [Niastella koreensis GR20-10]OQP47685.1 hypothetical protein A4D02_30645 [Niastella koreensis]